MRGSDCHAHCWTTSGTKSRSSIHNWFADWKMIKDMRRDGTTPVGVVTMELLIYVRNREEL